MTWRIDRPERDRETAKRIPEHEQARAQMSKEKNKGKQGKRQQQATRRQGGQPTGKNRNSGDKNQDAAKPRAISWPVILSATGVIIAIVALTVSYWQYRSRRAWVMLDSVTASAPIVPYVPLRLSVVYKNTGQSPAVITAREGVAVAADDGKHAQTLDYASRPPATLKLGAGQQRESFVDFPKGISADTVERIRSGNMSVYAYGLLDYDDGAGGVGHTAYCGIWKPPNATRASEGFAECGVPGHNFAD